MTAAAKALVLLRIAAFLASFVIVVSFQASAFRSQVCVLPRPEGTRSGHPSASLQGRTCDATIYVLTHFVRFQVSAFRSQVSAFRFPLFASRESFAPSLPPEGTEREKTAKAWNAGHARAALRAARP